ncbi:MAG: hypothetical protein NTV51_04070, partial [Verrucomicrobia bacterium]|nr:hypothetical protein [Verrucomicrobiota bacterium]
PRLAAWTKNLVIAASYGLSAPEMKQGRATLAPFRDSYQTALHLAAKHAFGRNHPGSRFAGAVAEQEFVDALTQLRPKIFEVGRTEAIEVTTPDQTCPDEDDFFATLFLRITTLSLNKSARFALGVGLWLCVWLFPMYRFWTKSTSFTARLALAGAMAGSGGLILMTMMRHQFDYFVIPAGLVLIGLCALGNRRGIGPELGAALTFSFGVGVTLTALYLGFSAKAGAWDTMEPFRWTEGVSLWPANLLRLVGGALAVFWAVSIHRSLRKLNRELGELFMLEKRRRPFVRVRPAGSVVVERNVYAWPNWRRYVERSGGSNLLRRAAGWTLGLLVMWLYVAVLQSNAPAVPGRGEFSFAADLVIHSFAIAAFAFLTAQVVLVTAGACHLTRKLAAARTAWPAELALQEAHRLQMPADTLDGWLDIGFVSRLTAVVGRLVLYPLIVLFLLLLSSSEIFDRWDLHRLDLMTLIVTNAAIPIICGWRLCRAAESARRSVVGELEAHLQQAHAKSSAGAAQVSGLIAGVKSCQIGAFRPFWEQPYVIALLIPIGGTGGIEFVQGLLTR